MVISLLCLPFREQGCSVPCYGLLELPKDLAARSVAPLLLKHLLLALGKLHLDLPFSIPLYVKVRRTVVVGPEPAVQTRDLKTLDLRHGCPALPVYSATGHYSMVIN